MLDSRLHPKSSSQVWQIAIPRSLILLTIFHFLTGVNVAAQQLQNRTIPITTSQIIYTPFECNASTNISKCSGAWRLSSSNDSISTTGPSSSSGNILPQVFFQFRASRLSMHTLPTSNATVNITLSSGGVQVWSLFDSSIGTVSVVNLSQDQPTLLTVTYIESETPALFGLESFTITVPENASLSSLLPTPTLPVSSSLPTATSNSTSSAETNSMSKKKKIALGVGITFGVGFGLTIIGVGLFYCGKKRKERERMAMAKSEWNTTIRHGQGDAPVSVNGRRHRDNHDGGVINI